MGGDLFIHQRLSSLGRQIIPALRGTPGKIRARKSYFSQIRPPQIPNTRLLWHRNQYNWPKRKTILGNEEEQCKLYWTIKKAKSPSVSNNSKILTNYMVFTEQWKSSDLRIHSCWQKSGPSSAFLFWSLMFHVLIYAQTRGPWLYNLILPGNDVTIRAG